MSSFPKLGLVANLVIGGVVLCGAVVLTGWVIETFETKTPQIKQTPPQKKKAPKKVSLNPEQMKLYECKTMLDSYPESPKPAQYTRKIVNEFVKERKWEYALQGLDLLLHHFLSNKMLKDFLSILIEHSRITAKQNLLTQAEEILLRSLEVPWEQTDSLSSLWLRLIKNSLALGKEEEAQEAADKLLTILPTARMMHRIAKYYFSFGKFEKAEKYWLAGLGMLQNEQLSYENYIISSVIKEDLSNLYAHLQRHKESIDLLQEVLALPPPYAASSSFFVYTKTLQYETTESRQGVILTLRIRTKRENGGPVIRDLRLPSGSVIVTRMVYSPEASSEEEHIYVVTSKESKDVEVRLPLVSNVSAYTHTQIYSDQNRNILLSEHRQIVTQKTLP